MPLSATDPSLDRDGQQMRIQSADVARLTQDVFDAMLNMKFDPTPILREIEDEDSLHSCVRIGGDWNAEVRVIAPRSLARRISRSMFCLEDDDISEADVNDALGEVVNIIGGNVKGMINHDCSLSPPYMSTGVDLVDGNALSITFDCNGSPLTVVVNETPCP
ncbi:MAG: chemotaxis protein CheX [Pirellulaceae bacterium]|jgi:chemotaxis protein CheX